MTLEFLIWVSCCTNTSPPSAIAPRLFYDLALSSDRSRTKPSAVLCIDLENYKWKILVMFPLQSPRSIGAYCSGGWNCVISWSVRCHRIYFRSMQGPLSIRKMKILQHAIVGWMPVNLHFHSGKIAGLWYFVLIVQDYTIFTTFLSLRI